MSDHQKLFRVREPSPSSSDGSDDSDPAAFNRTTHPRAGHIVERGEHPVAVTSPEPPGGFGSGRSRPGRQDWPHRSSNGQSNQLQYLRQRNKNDHRRVINTTTGPIHFNTTNNTTHNTWNHGTRPDASQSAGSYLLSYRAVPRVINWLWPVLRWVASLALIYYLVSYFLPSIVRQWGWRFLEMLQVPHMLSHVASFTRSLVCSMPGLCSIASWLGTSPRPPAASMLVDPSSSSPPESVPPTETAICSPQTLVPFKSGPGVPWLAVFESAGPGIETYQEVLSADLKVRDAVGDSVAKLISSSADFQDSTSKELERQRSDANSILRLICSPRNASHVLVATQGPGAALIASDRQRRTLKLTGQCQSAWFFHDNPRCSDDKKARLAEHLDREKRLLLHAHHVVLDWLLRAEALLSTAQTAFQIWEKERQDMANLGGDAAGRFCAMREGVLYQNSKAGSGRPSENGKRGDLNDDHRGLLGGKHGLASSSQARMRAGAFANNVCAMKEFLPSKKPQPHGEGGFFYRELEQMKRLVDHVEQMSGLWGWEPDTQRGDAHLRQFAEDGAFLAAFRQGTYLEADDVQGIANQTVSAVREYWRLARSLWGKAENE